MRRRATAALIVLLRKAAGTCRQKSNACAISLGSQVRASRAGRHNEMTGLYRNLLYLYPASYRREFGEEMTSVFTQARDEMRERRLTARIRFSCAEIAGL